MWSSLWWARGQTGGLLIIWYLVPAFLIPASSPSVGKTREPDLVVPSSSAKNDKPPPPLFPSPVALREGLSFWLLLLGGAGPSFTSARLGPRIPLSRTFLGRSLHGGCGAGCSQSLGRCGLDDLLGDLFCS